MLSSYRSAAAISLTLATFGSSCSSTASGVAASVEPVSNVAAPLLLSNEMAESVRWLGARLQEVRFENPIARGQLDAIHGALTDPRSRAWQSIAEGGVHSLVVRPLSAKGVQEWARGYPQAFFSAVRVAALQGDLAFRFSEETGQSPFLVCCDTATCFYKLPMISVGTVDPAPTPENLGELYRIQCSGAAGVGGGIFLARDEMFGRRTILIKKPILEQLVGALKRGSARLVSSSNQTGGHH